MRRLGHLGLRFVGSLSPHYPSKATRQWVASVLQTGEWSLWKQMGAADQRHAVKVATRVRRHDVDLDVVAAALLHDVGKIDSHLGTFARVMATLLASTLGYGRVSAWSARTGIVGRIGKYVTHDRIGSRLLAGVSARPLAVHWAAQHHGGLPSKESDEAVPPRIAQILASADGD